MTPPTRKDRTALSALPACCPSPSGADPVLDPRRRPGLAVHHHRARASLNGLRLAQEPTVPTLRERVVQAGLEAIGTPMRGAATTPPRASTAAAWSCMSFAKSPAWNCPAPRASSAPRAKPSRTSRTCVPATWCSSPPGAEASPRTWASTSARTVRARPAPWRQGARGRNEESVLDQALRRRPSLSGTGSGQMLAQAER